jgi:regulator of protease activity HflC (stomatin/prohibitin superfamily)
LAALIVLAVLAFFALFVAAKTVRIIPQARAGVVERFGRYSRTLNPGLTIVVPFVDRVKPLLDLREQVVTFQPQPVITGTTSPRTSTPSCTSRSPTRSRRPTRSPTRCRRSSS